MSNQFSFKNILLFLIFASIFQVSVAEISAQTRRQNQTIKAELKLKKGRGKIDKNLGKPVKSRGTSDQICEVEILNQTQFRVNVYINERYRETLTGMEKTKLSENAGRIKIYSRTDRNAQNKFNFWGPGYFACGSNSSGGNIFLVISNKNL